MDDLQKGHGIREIPPECVARQEADSQYAKVRKGCICGFEKEVAKPSGVEIGNVQMCQSRAVKEKVCEPLKLAVHVVVEYMVRCKPLKGAP